MSEIRVIDANIKNKTKRAALYNNESDHSIDIYVYRSRHLVYILYLLNYYSL